jgi:putative effector of murein hydrolase
MPALGTKILKSVTKERAKHSLNFAVGFAIGYLSHAAGLF